MTVPVTHSTDPEVSESDKFQLDDVAHWFCAKANGMTFEGEFVAGKIYKTWCGAWLEMPQFAPLIDCPLCCLYTYCPTCGRKRGT